MAKFINPFTDVGFKRIFGQEFSKPLLLDFLNNLLVGERHITSVQIVNNEQPAEYNGDRSPEFDVFCETDSGEKIIVEMQNREQPNFKERTLYYAERTLYYAAESIVRQGEKGALWDYGIKAVYVVAFMNFSFGELPDEFRIDAGLTNLSSGDMFCDKLRLIYLQLPLFRKEADDCNNDFERWIYVLKNMDTLNRLPWIAQNAVFRRLAEIGEVSALSKEDRIKYDRSLKAFRDAYNTYAWAEKKAMEKGMAEGMEKGMAEGMEKGMAEGMEKGMAEGLEKGMAEGMEKGMAEGEEKGKRDNARRMKADGMSAELIAKYTGLSAEVIAEL